MSAMILKPQIGELIGDYIVEVNQSICAIELANGEELRLEGEVSLASYESSLEKRDRLVMLKRLKAALDSNDFLAVFEEVAVEAAANLVQQLRIAHHDLEENSEWGLWWAGQKRQVKEADYRLEILREIANFTGLVVTSPIFEKMDHREFGREFAIARTRYRRLVEALWPSK